MFYRKTVVKLFFSLFVSLFLVAKNWTFFNCFEKWHNYKLSTPISSNVNKCLCIQAFELVLITRPIWYIVSVNSSPYHDAVTPAAKILLTFNKPTTRQTPADPCISFPLSHSVSLHQSISYMQCHAWTCLQTVHLHVCLIRFLSEATGYFWWRWFPHNSDQNSSKIRSYLKSPCSQ